jgi:predicted metal-dependent peptidase
MNQDSLAPRNHQETLDRMRQGLRLVCASLPHLSELAAAVRLQIEPRVKTAGIFASGRLVLNPDFAASLSLGELTFILAHELLHLALKTHERGLASDPLLVNYAHDYIINDMLMHDLACPVPAGGLYRPDARFQSLESLVKELEQMREHLPRDVWEADALGDCPLGGGGGRATQPGEQSSPPAGDALPSELERQWYPDATPQQQQAQAQRVSAAAAQAQSLGLLLDALAEDNQRSRPGNQPGHAELLAEAVKLNYQPPWEKALQRWLEAVALRTRSFARPSRRGQRQDVVLPGRVREGWTLHIVLDCSGSMAQDLALALGAIAAFCEGVGVETVRLVQCDVEVTRDEWVTPAELARHTLNGLGGTDLTPALAHLAEDPEVEAVLVLTDEDVLWAPRLEKPPPFDLLWVLMRPVPDFQPPYGSVIPLLPASPELVDT